ncbi:MAG: hypothetical protein JXR50_12000 [Prolixibacteraceae bacterium]|nr:hypothetical protein [Prolixibacteraceae bacterium]MBN2650454.1 hypothetical protein [Prolixibacteraceae bacterium]
MKNVNALLVIVLIIVGSVRANAQWSTGADLYSSYVWRGVQYGGPSVQPYVDYTKGGFSIGAWGSAGFDGTMEMDLYASYGFDFGLSIGATDYYYPGTEYFEFSDSIGAHGFELNLAYEVKGLSLSANYMLNEAGGAGTAGGDMYFELGYSFKSLDLFVGAGDGWHTPDGEFGVVNVGIGTSKEISITEKFSLPVSGSVILNPTTEQFYIVVGISL